MHGNSWLCFAYKASAKSSYVEDFDTQLIDPVTENGGVLCTLVKLIEPIDRHIT